MTSHTLEEGSGFLSERYSKNRNPAYKKLIADLAQHLGKEDVKLIVFNCSLPESLKQSSALDVLDYLEKHAKFSPTNIRPLAKLLTDACRNDLVKDYVKEFQHKYGRHSSMPASGNQQLLLDRRAYTSPSSMREAISQPTLHHLQPPNDAHPKAMHQCGYQMQPGVMQSEPQKPHQGGSIHYHNPLVSDQDSIRASSNPSQDSGVEMMYYKHPPSTVANADTIALEEIPQALPTQASHYSADNSLSNPSKYLTSTPGSRRTREYGQASTTPPPEFYRPTPLAAQPHVHKKTSTAPSSTVSDSGVEMMYYKHPPSAGASADTIEPWMSVSQDKEQFEQFLVQPRPRVTSVSAAVQTEGEGGSEKTASPAALNPRVDESENHSGGQDNGKQVENKKGTGGSDALPEKKVENEEPRRQLDQSKAISSYNSLPGVEVVGEEELVVTNKPMTFHWKDYGFKLHVPENALPKGVSEYLVNIKASLAGQFELPKGYELVSAVYWVRTPGKFKKPVTIEAQHCASFSDPSQLRFVHTSCALPYKFKVIDGGSFSLNNKYGMLSTIHFSGKGIAKKVTPGEHSCQYCAQVYFTVKHLQDHWYYCHFVVTKHLEMCLAAVRKKYQQEYDIAPPITFGGDHVALDIPDDGAQTDSGWEIRPNYKPQIKKDRVNSFSASEDTVVPECVLLLKWNQPEKALKPLEYKVKLQGTGDEEDFFLMVYHPDAGSQHRVSVSSSSLQTEETTTVSTTENQKKPPAVEESPQIELTINDLVDVTKYLVNLGQTNIYYLGLTLGLNHPHLKNMESSNTFKEDMIAAWLQKEDQVTRRGLPTWETLVNALRDDQVKQNGVADKIAMDKNLDIML